MSGAIAAHEGAATVALRDLLTELGDLKRVRSAGRTGSVAERAFTSAWAALCGGEPLDKIMRTSVASALAAARLGDLDAVTLAGLGLVPTVARNVLQSGFDAVSGPMDPALAAILRAALGATPAPGVAPPFVAALNAQPRAGATCPGKARILFEPPETHGEHCWAVAVFGVVLSPLYDADPSTVFLAGLAHHLHNAMMPDSGFTGEILLGESLGVVCANAAAQALEQLAQPLRATVEAARAILADARTPEGRAFHAADVIDRVMQLSQHLRVATVTMPDLLQEWQLVHAGPVKSFQDAVLAEFKLP